MTRLQNEWATRFWPYFLCFVRRGRAFMVVPSEPSLAPPKQGPVGLSLTDKAKE